MQILKEKVGMVTGGGSGIGRATCLKFASFGAKVVVVDISPEAGQETVQLIQNQGGEAIFSKANVASAEQVSAAVSLAVESFGHLDIASNNAALSSGSALLADYPIDDFEKTYAITLQGVFLCMKYQIPAMIESGGGAIVNIGSRASQSPNIRMSAYDSAKAAVNGITRSAAKEYASEGIRVNCVNPGVVRTEGIDKYLASNPKHEPRFLRGISMNRLGTPEELAATVAWLLSDQASYITGQ